MYCLKLELRPHDVVKFAHLVDGDSLSVFAILSSSKTFGGFMVFIHFLVASAHGVPHPGIFGSGEDCLTVVVKGVVAHALKFIGLA
jgi:hypothetical protein